MQEEALLVTTENKAQQDALTIYSSVENRTDTKWLPYTYDTVISFDIDIVQIVANVSKRYIRRFKNSIVYKLVYKS